MHLKCLLSSERIIVGFFGVTFGSYAVVGCGVIIVSYFGTGLDRYQRVCDIGLNISYFKLSKAVIVITTNSRSDFKLLLVIFFAELSSILDTVLVLRPDSSFNNGQDVPSAGLSVSSN